MRVIGLDIHRVFAEAVDLLRDRQAETLATWLRRHPGVEVVARDRAGAYTDGIRQGAPAAVQVADRWHLLRKLGDAVYALVDRHAAAVRPAGRPVADRVAAAVAAEPMPPAPPRPPNAAARASQASLARRQARYEEAAGLRAKGVSISRIAALLGAERKTVRRWLRLGHTPSWKQRPRISTLAPFADMLDRRWAEGCRNAAQLWRELVAQNFAGRPGTVRAPSHTTDEVEQLFSAAGAIFLLLTGDRVAQRRARGASPAAQPMTVAPPLRRPWAPVVLAWSSLR
ncbi:hypothetical protein CR162_19850 [Pseudoroseomonas rhizosphaerae]|uniref:HTH IS21-type domain-containing protein n=1 Tax=Teichococcus rhizosphaerae TaxID=1335062 RepID=A0A2C6XXD6_9PROT|nr:hypothetical protein CR162_19850 [Pseudoroseomonas rhizosphaerae]